MTDHLQINALERAASDDINDLQTMAGRVLNDMTRFTHSERREGPVTEDIPRSYAGGLTLISDGGDNAFLTPGFLAQFSTTHPAPPGPLESPQRLAFNRANLPITLPVGAGVLLYLLEGQVFDVVTVQEVRDQFDVPSQTFLPVLLDKQVERQVRTQILTGTGVDFPAPSGDPWVTLFFFVTPGVGPAPLEPLFVTDLRPEVLDGSDSAAPGGFLNDGMQRQGYLATESGPGEANTKRLVGFIRGRAEGQEFMFRVLPGRIPEFEIGYTSPTNTLVHLYLAPLKSGGGLQTHMPRFTGTGPVECLRGIPVVSENPPDFQGRSNSVAITLPSPNTNYGVVPVGAAYYAGSFYTDGGGDFVTFTQDANGRHSVSNVEASVAPYSLVNVTSDPFPVDVIAMDLRGKVPDNAKVVFLDIFNGAQPPSTGGAWKVRQVAGPDLQSGTVVADARGLQAHAVPLVCGGWKDNDDFLNVEFVREPLISGVWATRVFIVGWQT